MVGIFLQARLDSTRLPRKILLPLQEKTVIEHAMTALNNVDADIRVLLTDHKSYSELRPYAERCTFSVFAGPEDDVLKRYTMAARKYGVKTIVRATGDNPLVSPRLAKKIMEHHAEENADYSGYLGIPLGVGVEVVNAEGLFEAEREAKTMYEREHVCPFLYGHPERYTISRPYVDEAIRFEDIHVTLDTEEDYSFLSILFRELYHGEPVEISEIVPWLKQYRYVQQYRHALR